MKKIKKLSLSKVTVVNLNAKNMMEVRGGGIPTSWRCTGHMCYTDARDNSCANTICQ